MENNKEIKQEQQNVLVYEKEKIQQILNLLNSITVVGVSSSKAIGAIFDLLNMPNNLNNK